MGPAVVMHVDDANADEDVQLALALAQLHTSSTKKSDWNIELDVLLNDRHTVSCRVAVGSDVFPSLAQSWLECLTVAIAHRGRG